MYGMNIAPVLVSRSGASGRCNASVSPPSWSAPGNGPKTGTLAGTPYWARNAAGSLSTTSNRPLGAISAPVGKSKPMPRNRHVFVG